MDALYIKKCRPGQTNDSVTFLLGHFSRNFEISGVLFLGNFFQAPDLPDLLFHRIIFTDIFVLILGEYSCHLTVHTSGVRQSMVTGRFTSGTPDYSTGGCDWILSDSGTTSQTYHKDT